ncbi:hypothetical protein SE17_30125, partial [Kouleothrix aurantiaca]
MARRPRTSSLIARRAWVAALLVSLLLLGGLAGIAYWASVVLDALLPPLIGAQQWLGVQNVAL